MSFSEPRRSLGGGGEIEVLDDSLAYRAIDKIIDG
jgi:hypothetical protein